MKKMILMLTLLVVVAGLAIAGGGPSGDHDDKSVANERKAEARSAANEKPASCPMADQKVVEAKKVTLEGKLLCRHCNLHETSTCEKVFQTAEKLLALCPAGDLKSAEAVAEYGAAVIVVSGTLVKSEDGTELLRISSAKKKA